MRKLVLIFFVGFFQLPLGAQEFGPPAGSQ
ncbi:MAG: hypothetical protein RLZZ420_17, partial [Bacteroidota bacterium]